MIFDEVHPHFNWGGGGGIYYHQNNFSRVHYLNDSRNKSPGKSASIVRLEKEVDGGWAGEGRKEGTKEEDEEEDREI